MGAHSTGKSLLMRRIEMELRGRDIPVERTGQLGRRAALVPLPPALLSGRISLSSGAMTALLNRLERAGYVIRTREHTDRRIVTLRSTPQVKERADAFFGPVNARQDAVLSQHPPELLHQLEAVLAQLRSTLDTQLARQAEDI
ncbi:MarR family transcriptional regulator [Streptomyces sp. SID7805]|nr:MarR family transcriptional regulator [Streptomyces sp. SID7805]MYU52785.1 MarR family transcriptional regulator [Streptomyces sp. SID7805]